MFHKVGRKKYNFHVFLCVSCASSCSDINHKCMHCACFCNTPLRLAHGSTFYPVISPPSFYLITKKIAPLGIIAIFRGTNFLVVPLRLSIFLYRA